MPYTSIADFNDEIIIRRLGRALERLREHDEELFQYDASERSICFRLGLYLRDEFPSFDVDCEYNRHFESEDFKKRLRNVDLLRLAGRGPVIEDNDSKTVFPDIIVHRRNKPENLLVIETKKSNSQIDEAYDREKLLAYKDEIGYRFARFLKFGVRQGEQRIMENKSVEELQEEFEAAKENARTTVREANAPGHA